MEIDDEHKLHGFVRRGDAKPRPAVRGGKQRFFGNTLRPNDNVGELKVDIRESRPQRVIFWILTFGS